MVPYLVGLRIAWHLSSGHSVGSEAQSSRGTPAASVPWQVRAFRRLGLWLALQTAVTVRVYFT